MIIKSKWFCSLFKIRGIALYPFIIVKEMDDVLINHERIHIRQQLELYIIPFYFLYFKYYYINRRKYKGYYELKHWWSYRNIPFEKEAFTNQNNLDYLKTRQRKSYRKYI